MNPEALAKSVNTLHSLPTVALRVNELLSDPNTNSHDLEKIIINDPGLTLKILKFVNSAYFGFPHKIDTLSQAITLIGQQELRNIVLATSVVSVFQGIPERLIDMQSFWFHSITCGVLSRSLAQHCRRPNLERFFIIGLLHGIGKLVLLCQYPEQYLPILTSGAQDEYIILEQESMLFGFSHPTLTAELLKQWQIPESIWQVILHQYQPLTEQPFQKDACILHLAAILAEAIEPYSKADPDQKILQRTYDDASCALLDLDESVMQEVVFESSLQIMSILDVIMPGSNLIY